jgi:hypothetical protein
MNEKIYIKTGKPQFDNFYPLIKSFLKQDVLDVVVDGKKIRGYRSPDAKSIWIRDYSDMFRGFKYFETDLKGTIDHFAETQAANGRIFDYFTTFPEKLPCERENWTKYVRVPVEADVEYRFVKAAFLSWQATGDDEWMNKLLPVMEKALEYIQTNPMRWEKNIGLVKRAYTIDTWDFAYSAGKHDWLQFQINDDTFWGIMHGDNSGYFEAFKLMSFLYENFGQSEKANEWETKAQLIKEAMNKICWNGSFYTHFKKITPVEIPGVNESAQLSFSNPMAINRKVTTHEMAVSIIDEYRNRGQQSSAFAEWFSIDPPFPDGIFGDEKLVAGAYINGGIMPLVGGELAKAAFDNGYESYGVDILEKYYRMISESGETYLWYFPDGTASTVTTSTSPDATPTDGWGSSAMLYGLIEGLVGIEDQLKLYKKVNLSPRWASAGVTNAEVKVSYAVSNSSFHYIYDQKKGQILIDIISPNAEVDAHVLLPSGTIAENIDSNGNNIKFQNLKIRKSNYVDFNFEVNIQNSIKIKIMKE